MLFNSHLRGFRVFYKQEKVSQCRVLGLFRVPCGRGHPKKVISMRCTWHLHPNAGAGRDIPLKIPSACPCEPQRGITQHPWVLLHTCRFLRTQPEQGPGKLQRDERCPGGEVWVAPREGERAPLSKIGAGEESVRQRFTGGAVIFWLIFILWVLFVCYCFFVFLFLLSRCLNHPTTSAPLKEFWTRKSNIAF